MVEKDEDLELDHDHQADQDEDTKEDLDDDKVDLSEEGKAIHLTLGDIDEEGGDEEDQDPEVATFIPSLDEKEAPDTKTDETEELPTDKDLAEDEEAYVRDETVVPVEQKQQEEGDHIIDEGVITGEGEEYREDVKKEEEDEILVEHLRLKILSVEQPVAFDTVSEVISEDVQKISTSSPFSDQDDISDDDDDDDDKNNNNSSESTKAEPRRKKKVHVRSASFVAMFKASSLENKERLDTQHKKGIHTITIPCLILYFHQVHMLYVCMQAVGMLCMYGKNIGPPLPNIQFSRYIALHFNCSHLTET